MKATVFATLTAVGLIVAGAALAQPAPEAPPSAAPPAAPPAATPAPAPAEATPPAPAAEPTPPAPPPPPPPPSPPPAPTGEAAAVVSLVEKACVPLTKGGDIKAVVAANGLKHSRDDWVLTLPGVQRIVLTAPTFANPHVCRLTINLDVDQSMPIIDALNGWAAAQATPLIPLDRAYSSAPGVSNWSWSADTVQSHVGMVFSAQKTPDGHPVGRGYDVATLLFSQTGQ